MGRFCRQQTPSGSAITDQPPLRIVMRQCERLLRDITDKRLRRGVFTSVPELRDAVGEYISLHNTYPRPFIWIKTACDILQNIIRANRRLSSKQNATLHQFRRVSYPTASLRASWNSHRDAGERKTLG